MHEYSLGDVTISDVDTQVVLDLMKGRTGSDRSSGQNNSLRFLTAHSVTTCSNVPDISSQSACRSFDAGTMESFPIQSPVSHDNTQNETITTGGRGNTKPTISDTAMLDCDCRVTVHFDNHFRITLLMSYPS
jgi:hypothetical protein